MATSPKLGNGFFSRDHEGTTAESGKPMDEGRMERRNVQAGLFWVGSRLKPSSTATLDQYHQFYNEELVPSAITSFHRGPKTIVRYKNVSTSSSNNSFAFAALSPEPDLQLFHGPMRKRALSQTRGVPTKAFNGDTGLQHIDFNNVGYRYIHSLEREEDRDTDLERADAYPLTMFADSFEAPHEQKLGTREEILFRAEYKLPERFQKCEHHLRSIEYKLLQGTAPRYLVLHFFDCEHTTLSEDVLAAGTDDCADRQVYSLLYARGEMVYPAVSSDVEPWTTKNFASARAVTGLDWICY